MPATINELIAVVGDSKETQFALHLATSFPPTVNKIRQLCSEGAIYSEAVYVAYCCITEKLTELRSAWENHPAYTDSDFASNEPWNPMAVALFKHPPGIEKREYSAAISSIADLCSPVQYDWYLGRLGEFTGFMPVTAEDPINPYRGLALTNSLINARARNYEARRLLREYLPKKFNKHINRLRGLKKRRKKLMIGHIMADRGVMPDRPHKGFRDEELDSELMKLNKWQLWTVEFEVKHPMLFQELKHYMNPVDFAKACTGQIHPHDIEHLIPEEKKRQQLSLF